MSLRLMVSCALVGGLIATGAVALPEGADARIFKGRTAQGYKIKLNVKERRFKLLKFEADLKCRNRSTLTLIESGFLWTRFGGKGAFRDAQFGKTDSVYFRGRVGKRRVKGRVRLTDKLRGGVRCRSRWIPFNARPR